MHSARRGLGSDVAGSRPYLPGDDVDAIDWAASAKLSAARGTDEFVVRERYAEEAPRVLIVCDRRPAMALYPEPWLSKPRLVELAAQMIAVSAARARGLLGYLDLAEGRPFWRPPRVQVNAARLDEHLAWPSYRAPEDGLAVAFEFLAEPSRALPPGTFVFVLSDFLEPPPREAWERALRHRWDVVPVVIQDPTWERSFPLAHGIALPVWTAATGRAATLRLSRREAEERREAHERRHDELVASLIEVQLEPVVLHELAAELVLGEFLAWADGRAYVRGLEWRVTA